MKHSGLAADGILIAHAAFALFAVFGGISILVRNGTVYAVLPFRSDA